MTPTAALNGSLVDSETIALDAELSEANELRARLESAIADNESLVKLLDAARRYGRRWRRRYESAIRSTGAGA
ncbi:hypothetical protein ACFUTX_06765 [Microbacterium sp. NPDC057407]|uniref:hypothetical protein n=1 Tax=Microbacterium sp. NPDC057407 TaxID=3346120 RepID=UPI00366D11FC